MPKFVFLAKNLGSTGGLVVLCWTLISWNGDVFLEELWDTAWCGSHWMNVILKMRLHNQNDFKSLLLNFQHWWKWGLGSRLLLARISFWDLSLVFLYIHLNTSRKIKHFCTTLGCHRCAKPSPLPQDVLVLLQTGSAANWVLPSCFFLWMCLSSSYFPDTLLWLLLPFTEHLVVCLFVCMWFVGFLFVFCRDRNRKDPLGDTSFQGRSFVLNRCGNANQS